MRVTRLQQTLLIELLDVDYDNTPKKGHSVLTQCVHGVSRIDCVKTVTGDGNNDDDMCEANKYLHKSWLIRIVLI